MIAQADKSHGNPFVKFEKEARGKSPPDIYLQDLVLNLYRGHGNGYLQALLQDYGQFYRELTLSMLAWYAKHGEDCPRFMREPSSETPTSSKGRRMSPRNQRSRFLKKPTMN